MASEIIVEFPSPLTDKEKKMIYGYKGEVVRCKDCKYRRIKQDWYGNNGEEFVQCKHWDAPSDMNGFCSWGKRR